MVYRIRRLCGVGAISLWLCQASHADPAAFVPLAERTNALLDALTTGTPEDVAEAAPNAEDAPAEKPVPDPQELQKEALDTVGSILNQPDDPACALVAIDPKTGYIRTMVGGQNFKKQKYNLAWQAQRRENWCTR